MKALAERIVMVTGARGAAGRAAVTALHDAGAQVLAVGRDERLLQTEFAHQADVVPLGCDLADFPAVARLGREISERFGRLDGLVHLVGGWRAPPGSFIPNLPLPRTGGSSWCPRWPWTAPPLPTPRTPHPRPRPKPAPVAELASAIVNLFLEDPDIINGERFLLTR